MLKHVDKAYDCQGLAKQVVKNNMIGLYKLSTSRVDYNDNVLDMTAELFVSKFGNECNLYGMMLYFANYLTEYKTGYAAFDVQDILQQFGRKFLGWWRTKRTPYEEVKKEERTGYDALVGREAKIAYLGTRLLNGETLNDLRQCNLMKCNYATEQDLQDAQAYAEKYF